MQIAQCKKQMIIKYHYLNANIVQKNQILVSGFFQTFFHSSKMLTFFGKQEFRNDFLFLQSTKQVLQIHMSAMSLSNRINIQGQLTNCNFIFILFLVLIWHILNPLFSIWYINISRNIDNCHSRWILKIFTYFWRNASLRDILEKRNTNAFLIFKRNVQFYMLIFICF